MPPRKSKAFAAPSKKAKQPQAPETENEFLEVADEFEASAGKWKAGDAARALRFYQRAISTYNDGLAKYPKSFDLAYNKALLLYNITQDRRLVAQLGNLLEILKEALDAHRRALAIDQENADVLFNTAQVLTSFAEELHNEADDDDEVKGQAVSLLQEAVELFNACLTRQEMEYSEMQELLDEAESHEGGVPLPSATGAEQANASATAEDSAEEWATVKEPVTPDTLLETALAQLGSLSSLATIAAPTTSSLLANLSEIASPIITQKLPGYIALLPTSIATDPEETKATPFLSISASSSTFHATEATKIINPQANAKAEADLAVAVFTAALASAEYESRLSETHQYSQRITQAFAPLSQNAGAGVYPDSSLIPILSAYADALIEFAENVAQMDDREQALNQRWTALETAQAQLTQATNNLSNAAIPMQPAASPTKASLYLTRGNVELLRRRLTQHPYASKSLQNNASVLLKNAGVYYRGAAALANQDGKGEVEGTATFRNLVVKAWEEGRVKEEVGAVRAAFGGEEMARLVDEMIDEGLVEDSVLA